MEVKITPKSCSKLSLWLRSQVKETRLFCDGQTKAQDEGELDPAYGKSECLLALLTGVPLIQLNESCFLQRSSACCVSFSLQRAPNPFPEDSYTTNISGSSSKIKPFPNGTSSQGLPRLLLHTSVRPHTVLQGSNCQKHHQPFECDGKA